MEKLALLAFLLIIVQGVLSFFQVKNYKNRVAALRCQGVQGFGIYKSAGYGSMIILVSDKAGQVIACEEMKGMTVFSRFRKRNDLDGQNIYDLKKELLKHEKQSDPKKKKQKKSSLFQAVESIEKQLQRMNEKTEKTMKSVPQD